MSLQKVKDDWEEAMQIINESYNKLKALDPGSHSFDLALNDHQRLEDVILKKALRSVITGILSTLTETAHTHAQKNS